jgi:hypothetical protein
MTNKVKIDYVAKSQLQENSDPPVRTRIGGKASPILEMARALKPRDKRVIDLSELNDSEFDKEAGSIAAKVQRKGALAFKIEVNRNKAQKTVSLYRPNN